MTTRSRDRASALLVGAAFWIVLTIVYSPRVASYLEFRAARPGWSLSDGVIPANADAYYWFRSARLLREGEWRQGEIDRLRFHPDGHRRGAPPWPALLIAHVADWTGGDVYLAGVWFSLVGSCLFAIPAFLYGRRVGQPAAGLFAGLSSALSPILAERSALRWIDTDALNLFALWWLAWASSLPRPDRGGLRALGSASLAGLSAGLFVAWYEKPGLLVALAAAFALRLLAVRFAPGRGLLLVGIFVVLANPLQLSGATAQLTSFSRQYLGEVSPRALGVLRSEDPKPPSSAGTAAPARGQNPLYREGLGFVTSEAAREGLSESLRSALRPGWLAALGLITLLAWAARAWRDALPLAPLLALGALGTFAGYRFLLFLAPLAGFGVGLLVAALVRGLVPRLGAPRAWCEPIAAAACLALFGGLLASQGAPPEPTFQGRQRVLASMQRAASLLPADASVWTSFGAGFVVQDVMGAATYADSVPDPVRGHLFMKGLTARNQKALQRVIAHLEATPGQQVVEAFRGDYRGALRALLEGPGEIRSDPYLLIDWNEVQQLPVKVRRGQWTPRKGWPAPQSIEVYACRSNGRAELLHCARPAAQRRIDLGEASIDDGRAFDRIIFTDRGHFREQRALGRGSGWQLVLDRSGDATTATIARGELITSSLIQLFLLGRYDPRYFELVFDDFPMTRLYRVKSDGSRARG